MLLTSYSPAALRAMQTLQLSLLKILFKQVAPVAASCSHHCSLQPRGQGLPLLAFNPSKLERSHWGTQVSPL